MWGPEHHRQQPKLISPGYRFPGLSASRSGESLSGPHILGSTQITQQGDGEKEANLPAANEKTPEGLVFILHNQFRTLTKATPWHLFSHSVLPLILLVAQFHTYKHIHIETEANYLPQCHCPGIVLP